MHLEGGWWRHVDATFWLEYSFYQKLSFSWHLGFLQDVAQLVQGLLLHSVEGHEERDVGARLDAPPFELAPVGGRVISEVLGLEHQLLHHAKHQAGGGEVDNVGNKEADQVDGELDQEKGGDLEDLPPSNHDRVQLCNTAGAKSFLPDSGLRQTQILNYVCEVSHF